MISSSIKKQLTQKIPDLKKQREFVDKAVLEALKRLPEQQISSTQAPLSFHIYSDGGARGNPGPAGAGAIVCSDQDEVLVKAKKYLGATTNNQAEYQALILGLESVLQNFSPQKVVCFADSELLIKQLRGEYKVKHPEMQKLFLEVQKLLRKIPHFSFQHIPRAKNKLADKLANEAMDGGRGS